GMGRTSFGGRGSYRICSRGCRRLVISRRDPLPHGTCLAKSSTSNRRERIAYRELVLERLQLVPKGHWTLAGGANHRFVVKIESEPRRGCGNRAPTIPSSLPGLAAFRGRNRWFASPANFRDASGVRYRCRPRAPT